MMRRWADHVESVSKQYILVADSHGNRSHVRFMSKQKNNKKWDLCDLD